jgi:hypothetical protein
MAKVKVYRVTLYNVVTDEKIISRRMATRAGAVLMRGNVIEDTETEIDASQLELGEDWTPLDFRP